MNPLSQSQPRRNQPALWVALILLGVVSLARAQTTAFTYNGRLNLNGVPVNGAYEMRFTLYDAATGGAIVGSPLSLQPVNISNGLFATRIDFGADVFTGPTRWLDIAVRPVGAAALVPLIPRQEVTSSPYSIRAETAATVASGSVAASQLNTGGIPPTPGQFLSYDSGNLTWRDSGVAGSNVWSLNGSNAYYNAGSVGIGTAAPFSGNRLHVAGATLFEPGGSGGGFIGFHSPNSETGMTINGDGDKRADIRFDGSTLKLLAADSAGPPSSANGVAITTSGNVGIGTATPAAGIRLDVKGSTLLEPGGTGGGFIQFHTPNTETGMTISGSGTKRADIRFDGDTLKLLAANSTGPPASANGIAITTSGRVGIGTTAPVAKLHAETSAANTAAVYGNATATGGVGVYAQSAAGPAVHAQGSATQPFDKGGFAKAMLNVDGFGQIIRCYNGVTGASTEGCGFTAAQVGYGVYRITFPFPVSGRFLSVSVAYDSNPDPGDTTYNRGINYRIPDNANNVVEVFTFAADNPDDTNSSDFMLIVF